MTIHAIESPRGEATVPTVTTATFDAVADVLAWHQLTMSRDELHPDTTLDELGLDSLSLMEFVFAIEDRFQVRIPEQELDVRQAGLSLARVCNALDAAVASRSI